MKALDESEFSIVGTGLMGTSLALALRGKVKRLCGVDVNPIHRERAAPHFDALSDQLDSIGRADVIVLAVPVRALLTLIGRVGSHMKPNALLLDLGSVKGPIVAAMDALPDTVLAIGGHPMCGKELAGPEAADGTIYRNRPFVLCSTKRTTPDALRFAEAMIAAIDAHTVILDAAQHDRAVAAISHLPYLISAALVGSVKTAVESTQDPTPWQLASSGFHDTSRLASSDVTMMGDTVLGNREAVLTALDLYLEQVRELRQLLAGGEESQLRATLEAVRNARQDWVRGAW